MIYYIIGGILFLLVVVGVILYDVLDTIEKMQYELGIQDDAINNLYDEMYPDDEYICDECQDNDDISYLNYLNTIAKEPTIKVKKSLTKKKK